MGITAIAVFFLASIVSITCAAPFAYVSNRGYMGNDGGVSVIDIATNKVITTVDTVSKPCCIAVSPDGKKVYVANRIDYDVSVIDTSTNIISSTITGIDDPEDIAITPDSKKVYNGL